MLQPGVEIPFGPPAIPGMDGPVHQTLEGVPAQPFTLPPLQTRTVDELMIEQAAADAVAPARPEPIYPPEFEARWRRELAQNPNALALPQWPPSAATVPAPLVSPPLVLSSLEGPDFTAAGFVPPDSMGDVGPTQYIIALNGRIRSFDKTTLTADGVLDVTSDTFFNSVRNSQTVVDPRIRFDRQTNRWFLVYITVAVPNRYVIAFSDTATISGSTTWSYTFFADTVVNGLGQGCLGDYETLGIDSNALYMGTNEFCGTSINTISFFRATEYVMPKAALVAGAGTIAAFATTTHFTPQGVDNFDASPTLGYFVGVDSVSFGVLRLSQISNPGTASPSRTTPIQIPVLATSFPRSVPHSGGTKNLDGIDDRLMNAVIRNGRLWTAHGICVDTTGVAIARTNPACRNGVRWYELTNIDTATPAPNQVGTIFDPASTNPRHYWVPSVNINAQGVVVMGFASAAANTFAGAAYARKEPSDPAGTTQAPVEYFAGAAAYNSFESNTAWRWGDYSMVNVDPSDETTFWTTQMYGKLAATAGWGTRATRMAVSAGAAPTISDIPNQTTDEDTPIGPIGFTVTDSDTPATSLSLSAGSSNPALVPVANIVFGGAGESRTVTITPAANAFGVTTITVTVSDGTLTASDTFDLTVTAVNDAPTISDVPNQAIDEDTTLGPVGFTVGDVDTPATSLSLNATSSHPSLVPMPGGIVFGGAGESRTITITPAANAFGVTTITVTVSDGTLTASDTFDLTVTAVNDAPTISDVPNQAIEEDTTLAPVEFTIGDVETAAGALVVTASSSNTTLVPPGGLVLGGSGTARTIAATPAANQFGITTITLSVSDGTLTASDTFDLTVTAVNDAPTISDVPNQTTAEDTPLGPVPFSIGDVDTPATSLSLNATSSHPSLVPMPGGIVFGGAGESRTITITPAANAFGVTTITVTVSDGTLTASDTFVVTVTPVNDPPTIAPIPDKAVRQDESVPAFPLVIADIDSPEGSMEVTASSNNPPLLPEAGLILAGTGFNRTLALQPAAGQTGSATVTVTVSDGALSAPASFTLTVHPTTGPPGPPQNFLATLIGSTLMLSWDLPFSGAPPTDYILQAAIDENFSMMVFDQSTGSAARTMTIPNVPNGIFFLRVRARNAFGAGPASNVQRIGDPPNPPTNFVATLSGSTLSMTWVGPSSGPPVTDYLLEAALNASFSPVIYSQGTGGPVSSLTIPGVPPGTFFLRLRSRNAQGVSAPSNTQVIGGCTAAPGPASGFVITKLGGLNVRLSWTAPPGGANAATDYTVQAALDASFGTIVFDAPLGSSATTFDAIAPPGSFFVRIVATNACGAAAASNVVNLVMP